MWEIIPNKPARTRQVKPDSEGSLNTFCFIWLLGKSNVRFQCASNMSKTKRDHGESFIEGCHFLATPLHYDYEIPRHTCFMRSCLKAGNCKASKLSLFISIILSQSYLSFLYEWGKIYSYLMIKLSYWKRKFRSLVNIINVYTEVLPWWLKSTIELQRQRSKLDWQLTEASWALTSSQRDFAMPIIMCVPYNVFGCWTFQRAISFLLYEWRLPICFWCLFSWIRTDCTSLENKRGQLRNKPVTLLMLLGF